MCYVIPLFAGKYKVALPPLPLPGERDKGIGGFIGKRNRNIQNLNIIAVYFLTTDFVNNLGNL